MPKSLLIVAAVAAGGLLALQPGLNADVARRLGTPFGATFLSILVSFVCAAAFLAVTRQGFAVSGAVAMPWYLWFAGVIGAVFVLAALRLAPLLGTALLFASVVAGQMIVAVILDYSGYGGYAGGGINPWRLGGIALVLAGVWMFQRAV